MLFNIVHLIIIIFVVFLIVVVFVVIRRSIIIAITPLVILVLVITFLGVDVGFDVAFVVQIDPIVGGLIVRRSEPDDEEGQRPDEKGAIQHPLGTLRIEQHLPFVVRSDPLSPPWLFRCEINKMKWK